MKWTIKSVTSNILMVTGAASAITGCIKQIMDVAGCTVSRKIIAYSTLPHDGPHPPPPPPPPSSFYDMLQSNAYIGIILVGVGLALVIISRKLRANNARP